MIKQFFNFTRKEWLIILVVSLGYYVDAYDLLVFSAVRKTSLMALGVTESDTLHIGLNLLNWQLIGLVIGGLLWGILADKFGRRSILFVSIITYSLANLANAFVPSVDTYIILRILAGIGLAGELGVGMTLLTENLPKEKRTYATTIVTFFGMLGAASGGIAALLMDWRMCYILGGVAGIALLILRIAVQESVLYKSVVETKIYRGSFLKILSTPRLLFTYIFCTLAGGITFVTIGLFIQNTPEFGKEFNLNPVPSGAWAIICFYFGAAPSEVFAGLLSKKLKSRKLPMLICYGITIVSVLIFCLVKPATVKGFYFHCTLLGFGLGYWTLLVTTSAEQFGTNIRATAATSIPNVARAWSIPFTLLFKYLKPSIGLIPAGLTAGLIALAISIFSVMMLKETFENNADFTD